MVYDDKEGNEMSYNFARAAQGLSDASWSGLGGGFLVFTRDFCGGEWYSAGSRPDLHAGHIVVRVPSRSISVREAEELLRDLSEAHD